MKLTDWLPDFQNGSYDPIILDFVSVILIPTPFLHHLLHSFLHWKFQKPLYTIDMTERCFSCISLILRLGRRGVDIAFAFSPQ